MLPNLCKYFLSLTWETLAAVFPILITSASTLHLPEPRQYSGWKIEDGHKVCYYVQKEAAMKRDEHDALNGTI